MSPFYGFCVWGANQDRHLSRDAVVINSQVPPNPSNTHLLQPSQACQLIQGIRLITASAHINCCIQLMMWRMSCYVSSHNVHGHLDDTGCSLMTNVSKDARRALSGDLCNRWIVNPKTCCPGKFCWATAGLPTILHIPYHTIPYHTIPYHTIPYHTIPYHTIPYYAISYHIIPYHTIPYRTVPYHTIALLCYVMIWYVMLSYTCSIA